MVTKLTLRKVGGSLSAIFPKELVDQMNVAEGDVLFAVPTDGGFVLTPHDPDFEKTMSAFEIGRKKYRNALRELAK